MGISKKKMSSCKRDNYLTTVRDFYGFTSVGKTIYSLFLRLWVVISWVPILLHAKY